MLLKRQWRIYLFSVWVGSVHMVHATFIYPVASHQAPITEVDVRGGPCRDFIQKPEQLIVNGQIAKACMSNHLPGVINPGYFGDSFFKHLCLCPLQPLV